MRRSFWRFFGNMKILNIFKDVLKVILPAQLPHAGKYK